MTALFSTTQPPRQAEIRSKLQSHRWLWHESCNRPGTMIDPQSVANEIRERITDSDPVRRLAIEVLSAAGTADRLTVRARHRDRVLTLTRSDDWWSRPPVGLADEVARELVAEALSPARRDASVHAPAGPAVHPHPAVDDAS